MKDDGSVVKPLLFLAVVSFPIGLYWQFSMCFKKECSVVSEYAPWIFPVALPLIVFGVLTALHLLISTGKRPKSK